MSANQIVLDNMIQRQITIQRYSNSVVKDILSILNDADKEIVSMLRNADIENWNNSKLQSVMADVKKIIKPTYEKASEETKQQMLDFADDQSTFTAKQIDNILSKVDIATTLPSMEQLAAIVSKTPITVGTDGKLLLEEIFSELASGKENHIRQAIRLGMVENETTDQMIRRLVGTKKSQYTDGIIEKDRRAAEAMVRTTVNHTNNEAANLVYKRNQSVIKGLQWHSTLDSRTTPICQARDGKVYPMYTKTRPPAHIRCRSFMIPVLKSFKELGINAKEFPASTRASMDGQVPEATTYESWLKSKPAEFQQEVLGKERAKLFSEGKYDLSQFINDKGTYIALKDLQ